jgi:hypothetical protein
MVHAMDIANTRVYRILFCNILEIETNDIVVNNTVKLFPLKTFVVAIGINRMATEYIIELQIFLFLGQNRKYTMEYAIKYITQFNIRYPMITSPNNFDERIYNP